MIAWVDKSGYGYWMFELSDEHLLNIIYAAKEGKLKPTGNASMDDLLEEAAKRGLIEPSVAHAMLDDIDCAGWWGTDNG